MQGHENDGPQDAAGTDQPGHGIGSQQTDAFWFASQQPPAHETAHETAQQPSYPGAWQQSGGGWPPPPGGPFGAWAAPPEPPRRRGRRMLSFVLVAILGIGIGAAAAYGVARDNSGPSSSPANGAVPTPGAQRAPLQNTGNNKIDVQAIANAVSPSVADISSKLQYQSATAEGTGIVISSSGLVLTNNHVVNGATRVTAQINGGGRAYTARVLGTDKTEDVALLRLQGASGLKAASIGDSSKVALGDAVVAIGNLFGSRPRHAVRSPRPIAPSPLVIRAAGIPRRCMACCRPTLG